jgi:hypothetical protein
VAYGMRQLLVEELSEEYSPPIGDLVREAIDRGERLRSRRRAVRAAGALAAVVAGGVALALLLTPGNGAPAGPGRYAQAPAASVPASASPAPPPLREDGLVFAVPTASSAPTVEATWAASLELLERLLPGRHSAQAWGDGEGSAGSTFVQTYVDRGAGPGMLRLGVSGYGGPREECQRYERCYDVPGVGRISVQELPDNCVQSRIVALFRDDGVYVQLNMATCLAWDGTQNPQGRLVLSDQEAIDVVLDPRWGLRMPDELVSTGAARFGAAPRISGG